MRSKRPLRESENDVSHGVRDRVSRELAMWRGHPRRVSGEPGGEERALGRVLGELKRALVGGARFVGAAEGAQQLGLRRVIEVVAIELVGEREELDVRLLRAMDVPER